MHNCENVQPSGRDIGISTELWAAQQKALQ